MMLSPWLAHASADVWLLGSRNSPLRLVPESGMFHIMRNTRSSGTPRRTDALPNSQILSDLLGELRKTLPVDWEVELAYEVQRPTGRPDALITITAPDGTWKRIAVEVKQQIEPKAVPDVVAQLRRYALPDEALLAVAPFLGPRTRDLLTEAGVSYADATGNLRLQVNSPAVFIQHSGAARNLWREERPLYSLKGPAAGRVVRALSDYRPPYGVRELANRARTPVASVSRVIGLLENEALVTRDERRGIASVAWPSLLRRWAEDYSLAGSNRIQTYLEPRGLEALLAKLKMTAWRYSVTGSLAAARLAPVAPPRLAVVYVDNSAVAADDLKLKRVERVDRGINVLLAEPFDAVVYERATRADDVVYAAPSQVVADLLTSSDRGPAQGEALLRWMEENEDAWRQ